MLHSDRETTASRMVVAPRQGREERLLKDAISPSTSLAELETVGGTFWRVGLLVIALGLHLLIWQVFNVDLRGDELRYFEQAVRMVDGTYIYPGAVISNPPLFPAMLAALMAFGVEARYLNILNIVAVLMATWLMHSLLLRYCAPRWALLITCLFVVYPPMLMLGSQLMTEPVAALLILGACRLLVDIDDLQRPGVWRLVGLSLALAGLALLKPLFGYAIVVLCLGAAVASGMPHTRYRGYQRWLAASGLLAILLCSPYLAYVHSLTGGFFSWGTNSGEHLYWMSIGGEDVWGSWVAADKVDEIDFLVEHGYASEVTRAESLRGPDAQAYYLELSLERIRENPWTLIGNLIANAGRVLFNYPFSFRSQSLFTFAYLVPNLVMYGALLISFLPACLYRRRQIPGLFSVMTLCVVYLCGNFLVASIGRHGVVLVGPVLLWVAYQTKLLIEAGVIVPSRLRENARESVSNE